MSFIDAAIEEVNAEIETGIPIEAPVEPYDLARWTIGRFKGEPAPVRFLVDGLIPQGIAGTIYSAGGSGKSTLALDLGIRVAIAEVFKTNWLGKYGVQTGGKVLYFSAEEPEEVLHNRIHGLAASIAGEIGEEMGYVLRLAGENLFIVNLWGSAKQLFEVKTNSISPTDEYKRIYSTMQAGGVKLVIFDTRSRLSGAEGAGNAIVSQEVAHFEKLAAKFGATVLILHHTNKSSYGNDTHSGAAQRGESAFLDCLRFGLYLQTMTDEVAAQNGIGEADRPQYLIVSHSKGNYTTMQEPIILHRDGWRFDLTDIKPKTSSDARKAKREAADMAAVVEVVQVRPKISQQDLNKAISGKVSYHKARAAIKNAVETGLILETDGGRGKKQYELPRTG
jgi:RecA-family ATPase